MPDSGQNRKHRKPVNHTRRYAVDLVSLGSRRPPQRNGEAARVGQNRVRESTAESLNRRNYAESKYSEINIGSSVEAAVPAAVARWDTRVGAQQ
jgi:hypothetical protein